MKSALSGIALLLLFNTAIAALLTLIGFGHDFPVNLLISQCIGGSIGLVNTPIIPRIAPGWRRWAVLAVTLPASVLLGIGIAVQFSDLSIPLEKLWQTLAIGLMFGVLGSIVFLLAERVHSLDTEVRQRNLAEAERSRRELEAHLRLLQAQIEPHFLFNTLANVASLIDSDAAQARRLLLRLIGWLRVALNRVRQERSSLGDELDLLENWLEILSIRFGPRLAWSFAVTPEARRADLPPHVVAAPAGKRAQTRHRAQARRWPAARRRPRGSRQVAHRGQRRRRGAGRIPRHGQRTGRRIGEHPRPTGRPLRRCRPTAGEEQRTSRRHRRTGTAMRVLIAEDEPLLADDLARRLTRLLPELDIVANVRDGPAARQALIDLAPDAAFLDIRMPGLSGLEVATAAHPGCGVVFVTAHDEHAVAAFEQAAVDYLLKPVSDERLEKCLYRLRQPRPAADAELLARLRTLLQPAAAPLRWLRALVGETVHLVAVEEICYLQSSDKYTSVLTRDREFLLRTPLKEMLPQLDPDLFWQVHRGTVVNTRQIRSAERSPSGRLTLHLRDRVEILTVSRAYAHLFRQM